MTIRIFEDICRCQWMFGKRKEHDWPHWSWMPLAKAAMGSHSIMTRCHRGQKYEDCKFLDDKARWPWVAHWWRWHMPDDRVKVPPTTRGTPGTSRLGDGDTTFESFFYPQIKVLHSCYRRSLLWNLMLKCKPLNNRGWLKNLCIYSEPLIVSGVNVEPH